ncbi:MAG TPA: pyridoxal 5'-phosphate synthase glutaminase subunit PdxT [Methanomassiliicoccales archaeon]|jgi:5'-phosphate synthase pdxT subunit
MKAGVVSVQGAAPEHVAAMRAAMANLGIAGEVVQVRKAKDLEGVSCLVLPGGESTTISKLLRRFDLFDRIIDLANEGLPIMGTCAGCVLLSKEGDEQVERTETELLKLMDMAVDRNAFGRQRESFEVPLTINGMDTPFPAVFIRAPLITKVWGKCEVLATHASSIVMAKQNNLIALSFHPELSDDTRIHEMLLKIV